MDRRGQQTDEARSALRAARTSVSEQARDILVESAVATDAILLEFLQRAEASFQTYDITGDEKGRFPGAELHKTSLVLALVTQIGPRGGATDRALAAAASGRLGELARKLSLLHNASEGLKHRLSSASKTERSWHIWPLEDRHLGLGNYEAAMTASTFSYFHELIRDNPAAGALVRAAEVEVEDRCRYRKRGDITGPRELPALNKLVQLEADLCLRALNEDLSFVADPKAVLTGEVTLSEFSRVMSGLFSVFHRRRLILKNWAMRHADEAGEGLVVSQPLRWYAKEVARVAEIDVEVAEAALSLTCSPMEPSNPSEQFLQRRPLIALSDGHMMAGCHAIQALRFAFLAIEHLDSKARQDIGNTFARTLSRRLAAKGARSAANLRYDEFGLKGDLDVVGFWDGRLLVAECKATSRFYRSDLTAHLRDEIESEEPGCAVKQIARALDYVRLAPGRIAKELGVVEVDLRHAQVLPVILLSGREFDGCSAGGVPIRSGPRLVRAISSAADLDVELAARPTVTPADEPVVVEVDGVRFVIHSTDRSGQEGAQ